MHFYAVPSFEIERKLKIKIFYFLFLCVLIFKQKTPNPLGNFKRQVHNYSKPRGQTQPPPPLPKQPPSPTQVPKNTNSVWFGMGIKRRFTLQYVLMTVSHMYSTVQ